MEHQHGAMLIRQLAERAVDALAQLLALQTRRWIDRQHRHVPLDAAGFFGHRFDRLGALAFLFAQLVQA